MTTMKDIGISELALGDAVNLNGRPSVVTASATLEHTVQGVNSFVLLGGLKSMIVDWEESEGVPVLYRSISNDQEWAKSVLETYEGKVRYWAPSDEPEEGGTIVDYKVECLQDRLLPVISVSYGGRVVAFAPASYIDASGVFVRAAPYIIEPPQQRVQTVLDRLKKFLKSLRRV